MTILTVEDLARDLKAKHEDVVRELVTMGFEVEGPQSSVEIDDPQSLMATLVTAIPQQEVIEKRIKPDVIRRRVKKQEGQQRSRPSSPPDRPRGTLEEDEEEPTRQEPRSPQPHPKSAPKPKEPPRKPVKKARKIEAARIIELPKRPAPAPEISEPKPEPPRAPVAVPVRPAEQAAPKAAPATQEMAPPQVTEEARTLESTPPASQPGQPTPAESRTPDAEAAHGDDSPRKKKRKEKRMQPAQIIGRVELRKPPAREPQPRPESPRPERPAAPFHTPRPMPAPIVPEVKGDAERRKKKKKGKETTFEERPDQEVKVRRRKEVLLHKDLYDERQRGSRAKSKARKRLRRPEATMPKAVKRRVKIPESVTVSDLAHRMSVKAAEVIQYLLTMGLTATMNELVDFDTAAIVTAEFGFEAEPATIAEKDMLPQIAKDRESDMVLKPPVITVMGHVDHGKTSLLDAIRKTHVTDLEFGGITQHIGAYKVKLPKGEITFLDTPGHEAFTAMRARGAQVTDFVVLVVAADDGVMEQTKEAINHARAAEVPILVAVNKIDKPEADRDRVLRELSEQGLIPEAWGGDTVFTFVSAKTGQGMDDFLDMILLQAEVMELKANPTKPATGTIVEARLDKGRGPVATVLVGNGTLKLGDPFVAGLHYGKVRAMIDHEGNSVESAGPASPVEVQGFSGVPLAGDPFLVIEDDKIARQVSLRRVEDQKKTHVTPVGPTALEDLLARMQQAETKELNLIIKGDVQGSVEALKEALIGIGAAEVKLKVIHGAVGAITESDVSLANASGAMIIGFNVRPSPKATQKAEEERIEIRLYTVIYEAIEEVRKAMEGMLAPIEKEVIAGRADVRQIFTISKIGTVAGCHVTSGKIERSNSVRLLRDNVVVHTGKISSMKRFKDDVKEAPAGFECGITLEGYNDIKVGDVIEGFTIETESAKLTQSS
ncbi:MAG: translation initiation factor IF-2 [Thermodesulfobacteriota bacterium]